MNARVKRQAGFTLVEILVAFALLLVGMTGIISMFSAGLRLERAGTRAFDGALLLDEITPAVREEIRARAAGASGEEIVIGRTPVPDRPGLSYDAAARPIEDSLDGRGYLVRVRVFSAGADEDDASSFGWLPMELEPSFDELTATAGTQSRPKDGGSASNGALR